MVVTSCNWYQNDQKNQSIYSVSPEEIHYELRIPALKTYIAL